MVGFGWTQRSPTDLDPSTYKNHNERLEQVAEQIPEFGGVFLSDNQSVLNIYLTENETDLVTKEKALEKVEEWFDVKPGLRLNVIKGDYTITQLFDWYALMESEGLWDQEGVMMTDLDERQNQLYIGVVNKANVEPVYTFLEGINIPREAVTVAVEEQPTSSSHTLQDRAHNDMVVKNGRNSSGKQTYPCKGCSNRFLKHNLLFYSRRASPDVSSGSLLFSKSYPTFSDACNARLQPMVHRTARRQRGRLIPLLVIAGRDHI